MAGRKTKYTPETVEKLTQAIRLGATYRLACQYAGIGESVFYEWQQTKPEFVDAITQAEGAAAIKWLAIIEKASNDLPQWAAWKLERRYPRDYGRTVQEQEHSGELKVNVVYAKPSADTDTP